jgi:hypothetical protein
MPPEEGELATREVALALHASLAHDYITSH